VPAPTPVPEPAPISEPKENIGVDILKLADPMMRGPAVLAAQQRLAAHGITITPDGVFGPTTDSRVRGFQSAKGLEVDGVVGKGTWAALHERTRGEWKDESLAILRKFGWRTDAGRDVQAVKDFQAAYNLVPALSVDGSAGPATHAAAIAMDQAGGKISPNF